MMENKRIIYTNNETGMVAVVIPAIEELGRGVTLDEIAARAIPIGVRYRIIDKDQLPQDRYFRNAWTDEYDTETVDIHRGKAEKIHMDKLRIERNKKLKELDLEFMLALEKGDNVAKDQLVQKKQQLRDMPQNEDLTRHKTLEDLKNYIPNILKGRTE